MKIVWQVEVSADAEQDFSLIFDHLYENYQSLGMDNCFEMAAAHLEEARLLTENLGHTPYLGILHNDILPGLRHVTIDQVGIWYDQNEEQRTVRVLAVLFGEQDHIHDMMVQLL